MLKQFIIPAFILVFSLSAQARPLTANDSVALKNVQQFIEVNPGSVSSLRKLKTLAYTEDYGDLMPLYDKLSIGIKNSDAGKKLFYQLNAIKQLSRGNLAPDFSLPDTAGHLIALGDYKGKYVLIDFWASWCVPCRKENPAMIKLYNKYKDKGFTILGVSLDKAGGRQAWVNSIKADGLKWPQVADLRGWDNAATKLYGIRAIPQNYLVDHNGKIVAKNLHGTTLEAKLASILGNLKTE